MTENSSGSTPSDIPNIGGQGRLAQMIATRGGLAAPEAPFVIEHREALIYMLCQAAELEHGIMCQYLFAAFSLKQSADEGLSDAEVAMVGKWRKVISHVAAQEMLHLALVQNLLSAIGAAPHFARPNLPLPAAHYPAGVQLALLPFGKQALQHFMFLERPEGMDLDDAEGLARVERAVPLMQAGEIVPRLQDFATVGHLYRSIEQGIDHLSEKYGERWLFVGPPRAQATETYFRWPELIAVTDVASAHRAIDTILEQGEGARGDWRDAHFGQFVEILDEYEQSLRDNPDFDPVRPVIAANVRPPERQVPVPLISDPQTSQVTDLFNVGYEILLQIFERFFAHTEETDSQLNTLADATVGLMVRVIKPLGDLITTLPAGPDHPGRTVGPSFELFYETDYLMPHREAAWVLLTERLGEAIVLCDGIRAQVGDSVAQRLEPVCDALADIQNSLAAHFPAWDTHSRTESAAVDPAARRRADELAQQLAPRAGAEGELAGLFHAAYAVVAVDDSTPGWVVARLADSVLRPLADAVRQESVADEPDSFGSVSASGRSEDAEVLPTAASSGSSGEAGAPQGRSAGADVSAAAAEASSHSDGPGNTDAPTTMSLAESVRAVAISATRLRGLPNADRPELAEATAALQDLACELLPVGDSARLRAEFATLQLDWPSSIRTAPNGPYLVANAAAVIDHLGLAIPVTPTTALCRCGASGRKPFCDASHARIGFTDAKDPARVPDRRDTYEGGQVTVFDNRGICQHSGLCTDRLSTVFRTGAEPFVAPSGGRMDEIVRAVRACPSGALGMALDGREAADLTDWSGTRPPVIEVTDSGPYRIRGGIPLIGPDGSEIDRAAGASAEHYALCRCGHSQNKPFCSGMHWYVDFRDPAPVPGHEPSLFEWAGGHPALTRMTALLYDKLIPDDPLLAPVFAQMAADLPRREAESIAAAFGAPAGVDDAQVFRPTLTEDQRVRWVQLATRAVQESALPADPEFRSAFAAFVEWSSRNNGPAPAWDWGPAGVPSYAAPPAATETSELTLPGPDEQVGFAAHIKPMFREKDRRSMSFVFDLWSHDDVTKHAPEILQRLDAGDMPCDGTWPPEQIQVFRRWTESGMRT